MITEQSQRNLESAFHKAVRANLVREPGDVCYIVPIGGTIGENSGGSKVLLITLSSFIFRLMMIYRIPETPANRAYYGSADGTQAMDEVFAEMANMCGGALNRHLSDDFPHLAMSTPYFVSSQCTAFLGELKPQFVSSHLITINDSVQLHATLCLCCSAPIEIAVSMAADVDAHVGELEVL